MVSKTCCTLGSLTILVPDHDENSIWGGFKEQKKKKRKREGVSCCVRYLGKMTPNLLHLMSKGLLEEAQREHRNVSKFIVGRTIS